MQTVITLVDRRVSFAPAGFGAPRLSIERVSGPAAAVGSEINLGEVVAVGSEINLGEVVAKVSELIKAADDAVYMAKRDGRNCVRVPLTAA